MCWRDDIVGLRYCGFCGQDYYGDLGHRGCPALEKPKGEDGSKKYTMPAIPDTVSSEGKLEKITDNSL